MSESALPNIDRGAHLLACFWIPFPCASLLVCTRFYSRIARHELGLDDWAILASWVLYVIGLVLSTLMVQHGGVRHIEYVATSDLLFVLKLEIINQPFGVFGALFGKSSVALFISRISGHTSRWRRLFLIINVVLYAVISVVNVAVLLGQCRPISALWDQSLLRSGHATCIEPMINTDISMLQAAFGAYLDFALALLPLTFLIELRVDMRKRMALCLILGLGIIAGVCACVKTSKFSAAASLSDPTWGSYSLYMWASLELPFVIIAACIPPSKPVWDFLIKRKPISVSNSGSNYDPGSNSSYRLIPFKVSAYVESMGPNKSFKHVACNREDPVPMDESPDQVWRTVQIMQTSQVIPAGEHLKETREIVDRGTTQ